MRIKELKEKQRLVVLGRNNNPVSRFLVLHPLRRVFFLSPPLGVTEVSGVSNIYYNFFYKKILYTPPKKFCKIIFAIFCSAWGGCLVKFVCCVVVSCCLFMLCCVVVCCCVVVVVVVSWCPVVVVWQGVSHFYINYFIFFSF